MTNANEKPMTPHDHSPVPPGYYLATKEGERPGVVEFCHDPSRGMILPETRLIAKQAMEIDDLKTWRLEARDALGRIVGHCASMGAPLNDNALGYSAEQLLPFRRILELAESVLPEVED